MIVAIVAIKGLKYSYLKGFVREKNYFNIFNIFFPKSSFL